MQPGFGAGRIGGGRIPGDREGLAATSAPIHLPLLAGAAGLRHPVGTAEAVESSGMQPDIAQPSLAHVVEHKPWDGLGGVTGESLARGRDVDEAAAPAAHAGLRSPRMVVRRHEVDDEDAFQALARCLHHLDAARHLLARGHQGLAVPQAPAVVLHVRHFESLRAEMRGAVPVTLTLHTGRSSSYAVPSA